MDPTRFGENWTQENWENAQAWIRREFFKKYHRARRILENREKYKNSPNKLRAIDANFERLGIPGVNRRTVNNLDSTLKRFIREEYASARKNLLAREFIHRARVKVAERMMPNFNKYRGPYMKTVRRAISKFKRPLARR